MKLKQCYTIIIIIFLICITPFSAQATTIVLLDMSGSMSEELGAGQAKVDEAFRVIRDVVIPDLSSANETSGLWAFGGNCSQFRYQGSITSNASAFTQDLQRLGNTGGSTPLAWSIREVLEELNRHPTPMNLIVVTDGIGSCGGDPCAEITKGLAQQMKISIHTVGLGM